MSTDDTNYDRGHREGGIDALLSEHGLHLSRINGSLEKNADRMGEMVAGMATMSGDIRAIMDRLDAAERTRIATAAALKDQEDARRSKSEDTWTPLQRTLAVIGATVALGALIIAWYTLVR